MSRVLQAVRSYAESCPDAIAFESYDVQLKYADLPDTIDVVSASIGNLDVRVAALIADNTPTWAIADLALLQAGIPLIPVPHFFTAGQISHLIHSAGIDAIFTDVPEQVLNILQELDLKHADPVSISADQQQLYCFRLPGSESAYPEGCAKVTFTSGSTGEPKGVCLSRQVMDTVATSLVDVTGANRHDRHLSLLPYATLLENIGGIYASLLAGATVLSPSLAAVGLSGSSGLDVQRFVTMLIQSRATSCIMIPQMLHALVAAVEAGAPKPEKLRLIAVGGAPVSQSLLSRAEKLGLPVFEGYGLSEASSVVAVNRPGACKSGSVGKLLPHVSVCFAEDGEILVKGGLFSGYLGDAPFKGEYWPTGDIGFMDDEGFLYLSGRKKHIFITAFGRNVSPEWVERELMIEPAIAQCCVFGEARPFNVAVVVPRQGNEEVELSKAIEEANKRLPDYAVVSKWLIADEPFSIGNGLWTGTGRSRRQHIFAAYEDQMNALYQEC